MTLSQGQVLNNRYRVVRVLGQGGFGAVYRAWDLNLQGPVALKENFGTTAAAERQFKREASMLFKLRHPNLPNVIDQFSISGEGQYLVMEYIEGEDLASMQERIDDPFPEDQVLDWIRQVMEALDYMHSQSPPIIHRDIKPANIRITPQGRAILVDFGIAKVYNPELRTTIGARAVTPGYSPHEQYGRGSTDVRTDIYSIGATLYALLTGQEPLESIDRVIKDQLLPANELNPELSLSTVVAIDRAMQMDPDQRYQSASEFHSALMGADRQSEPARILYEDASSPTDLPAELDPVDQMPLGSQISPRPVKDQPSGAPPLRIPAKESEPFIAQTVKARSEVVGAATGPELAPVEAHAHTSTQPDGSPKQNRMVWFVAAFAGVLILLAVAFALSQRSPQPNPGAFEPGPEEPAPGPDMIPVEEAIIWYEDGQAFFLDVRPVEQREEVHIPGTHHIPIEELAFRLDEIPRDQAIVIVDHDEERARTARALLHAEGFVEVFLIDGGLAAWEWMGYPLYSPR